MEQKSQELDTWKEIIEKLVKVEAKAGFQLAFYIRKIDHQALESNCFTHIIEAKIQIQAIAMKDSKIIEPKPKT